MRKFLRKYLVIITAIIVIIFVLQKINWLPSFSKIFGSQPVRIDNTPILIKEINELAQLSTVTAYDEVVADSIRFDPNHFTVRTITGIALNPIVPLLDRLVLIAKGKVLAGTDLRFLNDSSFFIRKDSVSLVLPRAIVLDAIINPSDFETFIEKGDWNNDAVTKIKIKARNKMIARALSNQILQKADGRSKLLMENFLRGVGFKKVNVRTE